MATVRNCPSCDRPSGPKFVRCMYCGTELPAPSQPAVAPVVVGDPIQEGDKARALLEGLTETARAMMPAQVVAKLEAQVAAGEAAAAGGAGYEDRPITAEISIPEELLAAAPAAETIFDVPEPSPMGDPSIPNIDGVNLESFDVATVADDELVPYESMRVRVAPPTAAAPTDQTSDDTFEAALTQALSRGGGPFGRRDAAARLILLPDPEYRGQVHWLRHRLASATGTDLYTAGQALQRDVPACVAIRDTFEEAEEPADHLRGAGLRVLTIDRLGWLADALPEPVTSVRRTASGLVFVRPDGSPLTVDPRDLSWAAVGECQPDTAKVPMVPDRNKTWGTAQAPAPRSLDVGTGPFLVLDLLRRSTRRPIRIRSDEFDFRCLEDERGLAAGLNLRTLVKWLSPEREDPLPLDDRFKRVPHVTGLPTEGGDARGRPLTRREVEFTEYVLLVDAEHHL